MIIKIEGTILTDPAFLELTQGGDRLLTQGGQLQLTQSEVPFAGLVDRTEDILWRNLRKKDFINEQVDTLSFDFKKPEWDVSIGNEVEVTDNGTKIFGGVIVELKKKIVGSMAEYYEVFCVDFTHLLEQKIVVDRYRNTTVLAIINDILPAGFTTNNVTQGDTEVDSIAFDHVSVAEAISKLADALNFFWYVDYDKDIHFFAQNDEMADFNLTDNGNYIYKSLVVKDDLSQLRNSVTIRGGSFVGAERTESGEHLIGNGNQDQFNLINRFSETPVVKVDTVEKTVGVEFLDDDADFQVMWSFQEKYLRFTSGNIPADTAVIEVTGTPLIPVKVQVDDPDSIEEFGEREFFKEDKTIRSREEALELAQAQLQAYKNGIVEAEFETYEDGLRSGQVINIQSDNRGINEDFLIQSVSMVMRAPVAGKDKIYRVKLATTRTVGIIEFLQKQLAEREIKEGFDETLLKLFIFSEDPFKVTDGTPSVATTSPPYMWMPDNPDDDAATISANPSKTPIEWNFWTWSE